jgi:hypothetical protein
MAGKYKDPARFIKTIAIDYTSVSNGPNSVASVFGAQTYLLRLAATSPLHFRVYDAAVTSVCTSADPILPVGTAEIIGVQPGQNISFVKVASAVGSSDGRVTISEMA